MNSLDWSVDPCNDFYHFSCNKWLSKNNFSQGQKKIDRFQEAAQVIYDFIQRKLQDKETIKKYENVRGYPPYLISRIIFVRLTTSESRFQCNSISTFNLTVLHKLELICCQYTLQVNRL